MELWPHQQTGIANTLSAIAEGVRRVCVTAGTGAGKSVMMGQLARHYLEQGKAVACYTNRKMLLGQLSRSFDSMGIAHGVRAAGYLDEREKPFQICSIQTENIRVSKKQSIEIHDAPLVLVDEAHVMKGPTIKKLFDEHTKRRSAIVGFTATPVDLEEWYDKLIIAGLPSELRRCGAIVPALHYGPDEPDLEALKKAKKVKAGEGEDLSSTEARHAMMTPTLFGRVSVWFEKLNPEHKPTLLFAPGVAESLWFAERFYKSGIPAAHIDADRIWVNGEDLPMKTDDQKRDSREKLLAMIRVGDVRVTCNRMVLREGIDIPELRHIILATVMGSVQTYVQSVGRGGRADRNPESIARWGEKTHFTIQDHAGHWHRLGSINVDRQWDIRYTSGMIYGLRAERLREKKEPEPRRCPACSMVYIGPKCICGHDPGPRKSRPVVSMDGQLREMVGDCFKPRREYKRPDGQSKWEKMYFRSRTKKGDRSFRAAMALFAHENHSWPSKDWPFMPIHELDYFRKVADVPRERLR